MAPATGNGGEVGGRDWRRQHLRRAARVQPVRHAHTRAYSPAGQLFAESYSGSVLDGLSITNTYDASLRRSSLTLQPLNSSTIYSYDSASRLSTVSDGTNSATYAYLANSPLVDTIVFQQNATTRMTRTNRYDYLNRRTATASGAPNSSSALSSFAYAYNDANQRVAVTNVDSTRWSWGYDALGQVTNGKKYWSDNTFVAGQQFEYAFDDIGNRKQTAAGGNQSGASLRTNTYGANLLNQYTNRTVGGYVEVLGSANSSATVTVNNESTYRKGPYFRKEVSVDNSSAAVWPGITNVAVLAGAGTNGADIVATKTGNVLVPQTPETFTYDADGNTTSDGRFTYTWDAENRLLTTESLTTAPASSRVRQEWTHLPDGRWAQRIISTWDGNSYVPQSTNRFLWDDRVLLAVLNGSNQPEQTYLRGLDLSGTMQGAGGVGGLLAVSLGSNGTHFACFDGNGNVAALVSADGTGLSAVYEYDPFGNTLRATGPAAEANSLRFSTQFADDVTRRVKYLYRDYDGGMGRWTSRDPIGEDGGLNIFVFVKSNPINSSDMFGLKIGRIQIFGGHNTADDEKTPIPDSGLEGNYQIEFKGKIEKRKACEKIGFVGCGMDGLNAMSLKLGFGVPGMPKAQHPIFPASMDLLAKVYFKSKLQLALTAAQAEAKNICKLGDCMCGQVNIRITCIDEDAQALAPGLCGYSEVVKCK